MEDTISRGDVAGLVTLVWRRGKELSCDALGWQSLEHEIPMQRETVFRIASMTKPITAAAAMILVEEGQLRLDDPVHSWLPELREVTVLPRADACLDVTGPASRSITLRDLLTHRAGFALPGFCGGPLDNALSSFNDGPFPCLRRDEWLRALANLPLPYDVGTRWSYGYAMDVIGVLISRVSGRSFGEFLQERIFEPLGMTDTGFVVREQQLPRFATLYQRDENQSALRPGEQPGRGDWSHPPIFESGGAGLVSTLDDYLRFAQMLLGGGHLDEFRILSRKSVMLMTTNHLTPEQRAHRFIGRDYWAGLGGGLGVTITEDVTLQNRLGSVGQYFMGGMYGTRCDIDPSEGLIILTMTQLIDAHKWITLDEDAASLAYQALDD